MPRYDMLAVDLDGTLLDPSGRVREASVRALEAAREAGLRVTICTGRGLVECRHVLEAIGQTDPVVVAGGSIVACPATTRTLHRFAIDREIVERAVDHLLGQGYPVMVLKDPIEAGYDYLMVVGEDPRPLDPVTRWWFEALGVRVRYTARASGDEHPEHTVRVGICARSGHLERIAPDLDARLEGRAVMHHFPAVVAPEHASDDGEGGTLHVLEVFDRGANKWSAVGEVARRLGVDPTRIAAIGDQVNDLPMIRGAGLGIAMGNATASVRASAARVTASNDEDGVALAIGKILVGEW